MNHKSNKLNPLSIGFIGGSIGSGIGYTHFASSSMDKYFVLNAGCFSSNKKQNLESAKTYGVPLNRIYDCWQDMLKKERNKLDAIVILTPTPLHYEMVFKSLEYGYPVICEKSLSTDSKKVKKIMDLIKRKNGYLAMIYNYSGYPMVRELRHIIRNGRLGNILHFQAEIPQESFIRNNEINNNFTPKAWRFVDGSIPTIYLDLASHLHHLIYYLINQKPVEVVADHSSYGKFSNVIDNVSCLCLYSNGIRGQMWFSKSAIGNRNGLKLRIFGSKGSAEWTQAYPDELSLSFSDGRIEILDRASKVGVANMSRYNRFKAGHPVGFLEAFGNLYADIADSLNQYKLKHIWKSNEVFGAKLALEGISFFEAMVKSAKTKRWQRIKNNVN